MGDIGEHIDRLITPHLVDNEELRGACVGSWQKSMFSQSMVVLAVTSRRLIVQGADRKWRTDGDPVFLTQDEIDSAKTGGAGGGPDLSGAIMNKAAVKLSIKTTEGRKLKFMLARGTGLFGAFSGAEEQRRGVEAISAFLADAGK